MVPSFAVPPRLNVKSLARAVGAPTALTTLGLGAALALGGASCAKPARLTGNYIGTCTFTGSYRGGGRADITWTRGCALTLEDRSETELAMRFDTGDAFECHGHATQRGAVGARAATFASSDLTCRAKTLPAPGNIAVEQCSLPGTFEIVEAPTQGKNAKAGVSLTSSLVIADKRACVVSYLEKVTVRARLTPGGSEVKLEAFRDPGPAVPGPEERPPAPRDGGADSGPTAR